MSTATVPTPVSSSVLPPKSVVAVTRRAIDTVLIGFGVLLTVVLAASGILLTWGHNFSADYVRSELGAQNISFPAKDALVTEGRTDLAKYGGAKVDTGKEAEAYAKYINGHLAKVANGSTFADLGTPERAANTELKDAVTAKAPQAQIDTLKAKADTITGQRNTLFKGETLRGLLLTAFAWSTMGTIAGLAAIVSFAAAAVLALLVILGLVHHARTPRVALP
jgi:hypothetical protein